MNDLDPRAARAFLVSATAVAVAFALQVEWLESAKLHFVVFCGIAVVLGGVAWIYAAPGLGQPEALAETASEGRAPRGRLRLFPLLLSVAVLVTALVWLQRDLRSIAAGWLWLAGVLGVLAAVWLLERAPRQGGRRADPQRRRRAAAIGAVILLALALRTYRLEEIPGELVDDEALIAEWGMAALHGTPIWDGSTAERSTVFRKGGAAEPLPGCVVHAAVMQVAGETVFGLRFTAALAGAIGVGLLYLILREFAQPGPALAAAFLLAVCHTHLYWTRSGMLQALVTMAGSAVVLFTLRGLRSRGYLPWMLAGAFLGLAQHLYEGGRFLVPILVPFFLFQAIADRSFLRRHGAHVAAMALMSLAVFAPLGYWYVEHPEALLAITHGAFIFENQEYLDSRYPGLTTAQIVLAQLRKSLEGFAVHGDGGTFYPIWVPLFDPVARALVLAGILGFTLTLRAPYLLVSLWLWVPVAIACTVTVDPPPMSRLMLALPALFAVAGAVLDRLGRLSARGYGAGGAAIATMVGIALLGWSALWNAEVFFVRYPGVFPENTLTATAVVAEEAGDAYKVYFIGLSSSAPTVRFIARAVARDDLDVDAIPVQELGRRGGLFLVAPDEEEALTRLHDVYPGGVLGEHRSPGGALLFRSYRVEREELQRAVGEQAVWREPDLRFGWSGDGPGEFIAAQALAVDTRGFVYVADTGNLRIDVFDPSGAPQGALGQQGRGKAGVGEVGALAFERDGNLLALDRRRHWIKRLGPGGEARGQLGGPHLFDEPVGLAVEPDGSILVVDRARAALVRLSASGEEIARVGEAGHGPGQFESPAAVAVDAAGRVYVADHGNSRVQRFSPALEYETEWAVPRSPRDPGQILAVSEVGGTAVYVVDSEGRRVRRFAPDGEPQWSVGAAGNAPDRLGWPVAVAVDAKGDVYVLDGERASVYRFDVTRR